MDDRGKLLREAIERSREGQVRWRCPAGLRSEVLSYARERQASGDGIGRIAADLGVSESGLSYWLRSAASRFRAVRIASGAVAASKSLVLVTPRGYRLEGLDGTLALELLREL